MYEMEREIFLIFRLREKKKFLMENISIFEKKNSKDLNSYLQIRKNRLSIEIWNESYW